MTGSFPERKEWTTSSSSSWFSHSEKQPHYLPPELKMGPRIKIRRGEGGLCLELTALKFKTLESLHGTMISQDGAWRMAGEWEMTSLGRFLPSLQKIKLAFVILLASVPIPLKHKGFQAWRPSKILLFLGFAPERAIHLETSLRPGFCWPLIIYKLV